jgi:hypothetical protein
LSIGPASATNAITFTNPSFASAALSPWTEQHLGSAGACTGGDYDELGVQWDGFITTIAIGNTGTPMISDNNWHQATFTTTASISAGTHEVQISSDSYCYNGGSYSGSQTTYIDNIGGTYVETSYGIFMGAW